MSNKHNKYQKNTFWKWLTNIWTIVALFVYTIDFFSGNKYNASVGVVSIVYISVLSIYVGTKEFDRWTREYRSLSKGELYVVLWSALIITMTILKTFNEDYRIVSEVLTTYIAVLGVFAISQKSKLLKKAKNSK